MPIALIVDDHAEGRYLLRCLLEPEGFAVVEASNGREALDHATTRPFDLVVSDILMPVLDGFSLCRVWKSDAHLREVPFVFYTATYVDQADEDLALSLGADLFLIKPTDPQVFIAKLREALARHRERRRPVVEPPTADSAPFLRQYNEVLVHKLEDKLEQLEQANQALRLKDLALASSRNGIVLAGRDGAVLYVNPTMLRLCGKPVADVMGKPAGGLFGDQPSFATWLAQDEASPPLELELRGAGASAAVWLRMDKHAVSDPLGAGYGVMLSCADVTQEVRLRHDLARVQRLDALSLFAAGIAHDFNNLLMAIFSVLDLEASDPISADERRDNRALAIAAFGRARDLTRQLVSFAKHGPTERHPVDLRQLLDESIALSLSGSSVECQKRYCDSPTIACVDSGQMAQVFGNLLVNARQAVQERGKVMATIRRGASAPPADAAGPRSSTIEVIITDDGPGIPADVMPNLFEPYFTTKEEGTGLGLATSRAIVIEHGGQLTVHSQPGAGASFVVSLPAAAAETPLPPPEPSGPVRLRRGRILVMDDEPAIQAMLRRGLERAGYAVVATGCGEEAVREFRKAKAESGGFDLVLLDIHVQRGKGGDVVLAELRGLDPSVLAIATTGSLNEALTDQLVERGFARVVRKPFLFHELYATIKAVLPGE